MNCLKCNKEFIFNDLSHKKRAFCSRECRAKDFKIAIKCTICNKFFLKFPKKIRTKFCSKECRYLFTSSLEKLKELFEKNVIKKDNCWDWNLFKDRDGYGKVTFNKKRISIHRASWIIHNGSIPEGLLVLHHCDNPSCSRPDHLFLGTTMDNKQDCISKRRLNPRQGENHPLSKLNEEQVVEIRNLLKNKILQKEIANKFNVAIETISDIKFKRTWKHIND